MTTYTPLPIDDIFTVPTNICTCKQYGKAAHAFVQEQIDYYIGWKKEQYIALLGNNANIWSWMIAMKHFEREMDRNHPSAFIQQFYLENNRMPLLDEWNDDPEFEDTSNFEDALHSFKPLVWPTSLTSAPKHIKVGIYKLFMSHMSTLAGEIAHQHQISRHAAYSTGV